MATPPSNASRAMLLPCTKAPESGFEGVARAGPGDGDGDGEGPIGAGGEAGSSGAIPGTAGAGGELITDGPGLREAGGEDAGAGEMTGEMLGSEDIVGGVETIGGEEMVVEGGCAAGGREIGACEAEKATNASNKQSMSMGLENAMTIKVIEAQAKGK